MSTSVSSSNNFTSIQSAHSINLEQKQALLANQEIAANSFINSQAEVNSVLRDVITQFVMERDTAKESFLANRTKWQALKQRPTKELVAGGIGVVSGILCTAVAIPLAYDFGGWIAELLDGGDSAALRKTLSLFFGITAPIPIILMTATSSAEMFSDAAKKTPTWETKLAEHKKFKCQPGKLSYVTGSWLFSSLCGLTEAGVTIIKLKDTMGAWSLVFAIPDLISSSIMYKSFMDHVTKPVISWLNNKYCAPETKTTADAVRNKLLQKIAAAKNVVAQLAETDAKSLLAKMSQEMDKAKSSNNKTDQLLISALQKMVLFMSIGFEDKTTKEQSVKQEQKAPTSIAKNSVVVTATAASAISAYSFWHFGIETVNTICDNLHWADEQLRKTLGYMVGTSSITARAAMNIFGTSKTIAKIVDWVSTMPERCKPKLSQKNYMLLPENELPAEQETKSCCNRSCGWQYTAQTFSIIVSLASTATITEMFKESTDSDSTWAQVLIALTYFANWGVRYWATKSFVESVEDLSNPLTTKEFFSQEFAAIEKFINLLPTKFVEEFAKMLEAEDTVKQDLSTENSKMQVLAQRV